MPCHAEVFKHVQWQNLESNGFQRYDPKAIGILNLKQVGEAPTFIKGKDCLHYYTINQRQATMKLIQRVVTPETWELLKHYNIE